MNRAKRIGFCILTALMVVSLFVNPAYAGSIFVRGETLTVGNLVKAGAGGQAYKTTAVTDAPIGVVVAVNVRGESTHVIVVNTDNAYIDADEAITAGEYITPSSGTAGTVTGEATIQDTSFGIAIADAAAGKVLVRFVTLNPDSDDAPYDAYFAVTQSDAGLPNYREHPNTGSPNYNIDHEIADLTDAADILLEAEADSEAELEALVADMANIIQEAEIDSEAELEAICEAKNFIVSTEIDSEAELESLLSDVTNVLTNNDISGASFPVSPADGDCFYHTTHNVLFQYESSHWYALRSYSDLTLYVNKTSGSDTAGKGFGSGSDAVATIQYAWDKLVPLLAGGNVTINITAESYVESLLLTGKRVLDATNDVILFQGTLPAATDTGTADADSSTSSLEDDGQGWTPSAFQGFLVRITAGTGSGQERFIRDNDADTLNIAGLFATAPNATSTFSIYDMSTGCTQIAPGSGNTAIRMVEQRNVHFKYLHFNGGAYGVLAYPRCGFTVTTCEFDTQDSNGDAILATQFCDITMTTAYVHASERSGLRLAASAATLTDLYVLGCNTDGTAGHAGVLIQQGANIVFFRGYIDGNDLMGVYLSGNAYAAFQGGANVTTITNHNTAGDYGIRSQYNSFCSSATLQTFPVGTNDTDESADAATFSTHT